MEQKSLKRFWIYRSAEAKHFFCVCAAHDRRHALKIARRMFRLERTACAIPEVPEAAA